MATLHVRGVPDEVYDQVRRLAATRQRSLGAEVIDLLEQALADQMLREEQTSVLESIRRRRYTPPAGMDSVVMLREDRSR